MRYSAVLGSGLVGIALLSGCSRSGSPESSATTDGTPRISAAEIAEKRRVFEKSLTNETLGGRTPLSEVLAPLSALTITPQWGLPETAADALARIGPTAVPALLRAMDDRDPHVRMRAAQAFARMGPEASPAVAALTRALQDPDPDVRRAAARALGQIGPAAETAIPALVMAMSEPSGDGTFAVPTVKGHPDSRAPTPSRSPSDNR